jgi:RNA polymerase-binding transcription factor DksA
MNATCRSCQPTDSRVCRPLCAKRAELTERLNHLQANLTVEHSAEPMEDRVLAQAREEAADEILAIQILLGLVDDAIERAGRQEYGICADCGEPISPRRLLAICWAKLCRGCQEIAERALVAML